MSLARHTASRRAPGRLRARVRRRAASRVSEGDSALFGALKKKKNDAYLKIPQALKSCTLVASCSFFGIYGPLRPPYLVSPPPPTPSTIVLKDVVERAPVRNDRAHARGHKKTARPQVDPELKCESSTGWRTFQVNCTVKKSSYAHKSVQPHDESSTGAAQSATAWDTLENTDGVCSSLK